MAVVVRLFGGFCVTVDGEQRDVSGQVERRILVALCLAPGGSMERRALAAVLWPDAEFSQGGNRLRTGLVGLRKALAPADILLADRWTISLRAERVESDLDAARQLCRDARTPFGTQDHEEVLSKLIERTDPGLLPSWPDEWVAQERVAWQSTLRDALGTMSALGWERGDAEAARRWFERALDHGPCPPKLWQTYFMAMSFLGLGNEAARRFVRVKNDERLEGAAWRQVTAHARELRRGATASGADQLSAPESDLLSRCFVAWAKEDPAGAASFAGSKAFRGAAMKEPDRAAPLLERILEVTEGTLEASAPRLSAMFVQLARDDWPGAHKLAAQAVAEDTGPSDLCTAYSCLAICHLVASEWEEALRASESARENAAQIGDPVRLELNRAQRAAILLLLGRFDESLSELTAAFHALDQVELGANAVSLCRIAGNIARVLSMTHRHEEAWSWSTVARSIAISSSDEESLTFIEPVRGYVAAKVGELTEARRAVTDGLAVCVRRSRRRQFEFALDMAAGALHVLGHAPQAVALLRLGDDFREESGQLRSPAEREFIGRLREEIDSVSEDPVWAKLKRPADIGRAVVRLLEPET